MKKFLLMLLSALPLLCTAQQLENSLLWKITGNGLKEPSYLFGTFHITCDATLSNKVKKAMDKIISNNYPIQRVEVSRSEAKARIEAINEPFKLEILDSIQTEPITIYTIGEDVNNPLWWDLCAGPHVESTGQLPKKAIQLQSVAGAYWRGDEKREMLQRIYATAWKNPKQLKLYKLMMEEAKKRDHRMLGKKLDLFSIQVCIWYVPFWGRGGEVCVS